MQSLLRRSPSAIGASLWPSSSTFLPSLQLTPAVASPAILQGPGTIQQVRWRGNLQPRRVKHPKSQKGRVPIPITSIKGTTVQQGDFGIRARRNCVLSAKVLTGCDDAIRKKLKGHKGLKVIMRVFPDIPRCVKGSETRMGKGKGGFDHWAVRVGIGKVLFEVRGDGLRPEIAKEALRLASDKLPIPVEFVSSSTPPKLGRLTLTPSVLAARHLTLKPGMGIAIKTASDKLGETTTTTTSDSVTSSGPGDGTTSSPPTVTN